MNREQTIPVAGTGYQVILKVWGGFGID